MSGFRFTIGLLSLGLLGAFTPSAWAADGAGLAYITESDLPRRIVVGEPLWNRGVKPDPVAARLIGDALKNHLEGKGYRVMAPEKCPTPSGVKPDAAAKAALICLKKKGKMMDGLLLVHAHALSDVDAMVLQSVSMDAEALLYNARGKRLGAWRDEGSNRGVSLSLGAFSSLFQKKPKNAKEKANRRKKALIQDWALNLTALMPGFSGGSSLPRILRAQSDLTGRTLKIGDKIAVALEGDRGRTATFDLGSYKRGLTMAEKKPGIYTGAYVVREGDSAKDLALIFHLTDSEGKRRDWREGDPLASLDGIPPKRPDQVYGEITADGVKISWKNLDAEATGFIISRSRAPLAGFEEIGRTADSLHWNDPNVKGGERWHYRVAALDGAGNLSIPGASPEIILPLTEEAVLEGDVQGRLIAGSYRLTGEATVPPGQTLELAAGVVIRGGPQGRLTVKGSLTGGGAVMRALPPNEEGKEPLRWVGINVEEGGRLNLTAMVFEGCAACVTAAGGEVLLTETTMKGGDTGIVADGPRPVKLLGVRIKGLLTGLKSAAGSLTADNVEVTGGRTGILVTGGTLALTNANLSDNLVNLETTVPVTLEKNYLGALKPNLLRLKGPVTVRSLLDAPWPGGRVVELRDEELAKKATALKEKGLAAFSKRNYGIAYENLRESLDYKKDREVMLSLAFVLNAIEKQDELEALLEEAYAAFPYEGRFFNLGVRNLLAQDRKAAAKALVERALKLNPDNLMLQGLQTMVGD